MACLCGCGGDVDPSKRFKPGHDQRLRIALEARAGGIERLAELVESAEAGGLADQSEADYCKKELDEAFKTVNTDQAEYDKQLLTLSSGFLAVSLAFIKDVVPLKDASFLILLYSAFCLLVACITLVLFSFQFSVFGNLKAKDYWERRSQKHQSLSFPRAHAEAIRWLNYSSGLLFFLGVVSLVSFVISNINHEAKMTVKSIAMDGALMKVPQTGGEAEKGSHIKVPVVTQAAQQGSTQNSNSNAQPKKP